jgi:hypothetical protein
MSIMCNARQSTCGVSVWVRAGDTEEPKKEPKFWLVSESSAKWRATANEDGRYCFAVAL